MDQLYTVLPVIRLPAQRQLPTGFTYRGPSNLNLGQLVRIPWKSKLIFGVIIGINKPGQSEGKNEKTLTIKNIQTVYPLILPEIWLRLILSFSAEIAPGTLATRTLPAWNKKFIEKTLPHLEISKRSVRPINWPANLTWADFFVHFTFLVQNVNSETKFAPVIFIFDTHITLNYVAQELQKNSDFSFESKDHILIMSENMTSSQSTKIMTDILSGVSTYSIILATKKAWLLPWPNNSTIIVVDPDSPWQREDLAQPYYSAFDLVRKLSSFGSAVKTVTLDKSPGTVVKLRQIHHGFIDIEHMNETITNFWQDLQLSDQQMSAAGLKKSKVLIYYNRAGDWKFLECQDCGYVVECQSNHCHLPLKWVNGHWLCSKPEHQNIIPDIVFCPKCQGRNWKPKGYGLNQLAKDLIWPADFPRTNLILTTRRPLANLPWEQIGLVIWPAFDSDIQVPDRHREADTLFYWRHCRALMRPGSEIYAYSHDIQAVTKLLTNQSESTKNSV